jgi:thiosulfate/3-mercaptopyruvate sulfurtransferase
VRSQLLALGGALALAAQATAQVPPLPRLLATDTLAAWLERGEPVHLLDVRLDVWSYLKGHLPGAQYLNVETLRASRGGVPVQLLDAPAYRNIFQRFGLEPSVPVVVYGAGETLNIDATWVTWLLSAMGHPRVHLLDGGYFKWSFEHRELALKYPRVTPAGGWWSRQAFQPDTVSLAQVRRAVERGGALLVDARPPDQFVGDAGAQMRRGHIPGALNHWWQDDLETSGFGRVFKPVTALREAYAAQGITPDRDIILYCNTSTEASHLWFALRVLLGYPRVRIYAGSWTEWAEREELPVATGPSRPPR